MTILQRAPARPAAAAIILERELELLAIDESLTRSRAGAGSALIVEGEAGIGKSTILRRAAEAAASDGMRVLHAQGGELERALPYGVVIELFGPVARNPADAESLFSGPARIAAPLFGIRDQADVTSRGDAAQMPADPVAYLHGLFWCILNLVERGPLAVVVDDAQWADDASLRFLHHLIKRVDELPVVVLLAMRPEAGSPPSPAATLLRAHAATTRLLPGPLSEAAVGSLMEAVAGRAMDETVRRAAWEATGGNPFYVAELAADLQPGRDADPTTVASILPEGVGRQVSARLIGANRDAHALAEAVAALGECATLHRATSLAGLDPSAAASAVRWLVEAAILSDSEPLAFRHPIVRSAVDASIPAPARAELHRRAALLLADDGVAIGLVGAQLREAATSGDRRVVTLLHMAAEDALLRGEPETAVTLLRRALAEPVAPDMRPDVLSLLARAEAAAGTPSAIETFAEALAVLTDPDRRAALQLDLGHALVAGGQWVAARDTFAQALEESGAASDAIRARLEAGYLSAAWVIMGEDRAAISDRVREILDAEELGAANRELATWIAFQQGAVVGSPASEMRALVRRVFAEAPIHDLVREGQVVEVGAGVLLETDDLPFEVQVLSAAIDAARHAGPIGKAGVYAYCRAWPSYYMGRLSDAIADGEEAVRAAELGWEAFLPAAVTVTALAHIERDELDSAERAIDIDLDRWAGRIDTAMLLPLAAGRLALARGDLGQAAEHLRRASESAGAVFMRNSVPSDWRTWYATVLLQLGERKEAASLAAEGVEIARAWGAAWPLGAALRTHGRILGGARGIALLREGEDLLRDSPARLEHARALVSLGSALRRHGSLIDARETLSRAADQAQRIGARALLRRATEELKASGARPRRVALMGVDSLTPAELRVAQEALAGQTNREIAQRLFVTPKAVEFHLANTYRKLGIGSRAELAEAMGGAAPSG